MIEGKTVLIVGGSGSVGRVLTHRLLEQDAERVRILDQSEQSLARLKNEVDDERCRFFAGNVRDKDRLLRAINGVDIVVHTAAMKHVDICEYNPFEAVKTNVIGLQNLIDVSINEGIERFVFTSSDKAAYPANTMGTTKLLGERLVTAANKYSGSEDIRFVSVRFGNVVNSSQSVIPLFREQVREGGPVTLTDRRMTRFFITYDDVVDLVTAAMEHTRGGEIFIKKMSAIAIEDLAEAVVETVGPDNGYRPREIEIEVTGRRVGETFSEEIMTQREIGRTVENGELYAIIPEQAERGGYLTHDGLEGFEPADDVVYSSADAEKLPLDEITNILQTEYGVTRS